MERATHLLQMNRIEIAVIAFLKLELLVIWLSPGQVNLNLEAVQTACQAF